MARVAKSNNTQRKAVVKSATSQSPINGKTAILAIVAAAILLVPQTTMQSAKSIVAPDLPDPPPHREVLLPPFPPGAFDSCADQMASRMTTINQDYDNLLKGLQNSRDAKLKPIDDAIISKTVEIESIRDEIQRNERRYASIYLRFGYTSATKQILDQISDENDKNREKIKDLQKEIEELKKIRFDIWEWYYKCVKWLNERHLNYRRAAFKEFWDCVTSDTDED